MREGDILRHKDTGKIWQIAETWYKNLGGELKTLHVLWDATYTEKEYWREVDVEDAFEELGVNIDGKPSEVIGELNLE